jgi:hypothetical protein
VRTVSTALRRPRPATRTQTFASRLDTSIPAQRLWTISMIDFLPSLSKRSTHSTRGVADRGTMIDLTLVAEQPLIDDHRPARVAVDRVIVPGSYPVASRASAASGALGVVVGLFRPGASLPATARPRSRMSLMVTFGAFPSV